MGSGAVCVMGRKHDSGRRPPSEASCLPQSTDLFRGALSRLPPTRLADLESLPKEGFLGLLPKVAL